MKRSQVYFNLHKRLFSVQQRGKVCFHSDSVLLRDVRFNVAKAGQRKVRETGRKNVHARVTGIRDSFFIWPNMDQLKDARRATYNPYKHDTFVDVETGEPVLECSVAFLRKPAGHAPMIFYWN